MRLPTPATGGTSDVVEVGTRSRLLPGLVVGAGLWVVLASAAGAALSAVGWWTPYVAWPLAAVLAGMSAWCVRGIPEVRMPVAPAAVLAAVAAAFTVWAAATHSEQVLPRRDAASNLQAAVSLASTHGRLVPVDPEAVGGPGVLGLEGVTLASPAFFEVGSDDEPTVEPQFVVGPAVVYGFGWWAGGAVGAFVLPAVAMGLALLALGLLVTRVVGPWAGVASAALTGILFPVLHTARATYSEPLAMLTLGAGLLAATLAAGSVTPGARFAGPASAQGTIVGRAPLPSLVVRDASARAGLLAGLLVGGTGLLRVDALREVVLLLPVLAVGAALGARWVRPLLVGLAVSTGVAAVAAVGLSWEYVASIADSVLPLAVLGVLLGGGSWAALAVWRRGARLPASVVRRLPDVAATFVVLAGLYLASRPLWQVVRQDPDDPGARYVAGMQARQGLPVDGGRTYAEQTLAWLSWYVGPVALVVALVVLALATRLGVASVARQRLEPWVPALVVAAGSTLLTLVRPGITPDHPWADRRLLIALPLVVVLVVIGRPLDGPTRDGSRPSVGRVRGRRSRGGIRRGSDRRRHVAAPGWWRRAWVTGRRRAAVSGVGAERRRPRGRLTGRERVAAGRARHVRGPLPVAHVASPVGRGAVAVDGVVGCCGRRAARGPPRAARCRLGGGPRGAGRDADLRRRGHRA